MSEKPEIVDWTEPQNFTIEQMQALAQTAASLRPVTFARALREMLDRYATLQQQLSASVPLEKYDKDMAEKDREIADLRATLAESQTVRSSHSQSASRGVMLHAHDRLEQRLAEAERTIERLEEGTEAIFGCDWHESIPDNCEKCYPKEPVAPTDPRT